MSTVKPESSATSEQKQQFALYDCAIRLLDAAGISTFKLYTASIAINCADPDRRDEITQGLTTLEMIGQNCANELDDPRDNILELWEAVEQTAIDMGLVDADQPTSGIVDSEGGHPD